MQTIRKIILQAFLLFFLATTTVVANNSLNTEQESIQQAMQFYTEAASMDAFASKRKDLLGESETILQTVIANNPESLDAHRKLMGVYLQMRDYPKAIKTMQTAISLSPEDPRLFIALAILYDHAGAYAYALPMLDEALKLDPNQALAREYQEKIRQKMSERDLAMEQQAPHRVEYPDSQ